MNTFSQVPPGFRFHPTDEELVDYYLRKKVNSRRIEVDVIKDIDLYKIEPWDLQELCRLGAEEQNEWYFFSHKDKKYPTGTRTNRATTAGFWKATGRDKAIYLKRELIGMRKTLVFYKGRAPNGQKSDWIMHEYRLESDENGSPQEEGWAVCRVFRKKTTTVRRMNEHESPCWFDDQVSFMPNLDSPNHSRLSYYPCKKEIDQYHHHSRMHYAQVPHDHFLSLPHFDAPSKFLHQANPNPNPNNALSSAMMLIPLEEHHMQHIGSHDHSLNQIVHGSDHQQAGIDGQGQGSMTADWRILDKFVASQFSQEDHLVSDQPFHIGGENNVHGEDDEGAIVPDSMQQDLEQQQQPESSTSASALSTCPTDLWK